MEHPFHERVCTMRDADEDDTTAAWNTVMLSRAVEVPVATKLEVAGSIPAALRGGRYVLNGPGWICVDGRLAHPFDGHGYLREISFDAAGWAALRGRYIRTPAFVSEETSGRLMYRGLATNVAGGWWSNFRANFRGSRNPANTTVAAWAGQLICGWEGGLPFAVDPVTLETLGSCALALPPSRGAYFSLLAHMRVDSARGRLVGLQVRLLWVFTLTVSCQHWLLRCLLLMQLSRGIGTGLRFVEFDTRGSLLSTSVAHLPGVRVVHDFLVTDDWYIIAGAQNGVCAQLALPGSPPHCFLGCRECGTARSSTCRHFSSGRDDSLLCSIGAVGTIARSYHAHSPSSLFRAQLDATAPGCLVFVKRSCEASSSSRTAAVRVVPLGRPLFAVHLANAFQRPLSSSRGASEASPPSSPGAAAADVVVDLCAFRAFELGSEFGYRGPTARLRPVGSGPSEAMLRVVVPWAALQQEGGGSPLAPAVVSALCRVDEFVCDFPRVAAAAEGRDSPCVFVAGRRAGSSCDVFDCLARVDLPGSGSSSSSPDAEGGGGATARWPPSGLDCWQAPPGTFVGEPMFVPAEPGGVGPCPAACVLAVLYRGEPDPVAGESAGATELCIFSAADIAAGPVARLAMPLCPYAFHGEWIPPPAATAPGS